MFSAPSAAFEAIVGAAASDSCATDSDEFAESLLVPELRSRLPLARTTSRISPFYFSLQVALVVDHEISTASTG